MKGLVRGSRRLVVHSWRPGQKVERLAVDADDFERFRVGDRIEVAVQPGVLGIPGFTEFIAKGRARSINWFAVRQERNLQLQIISRLPESEFVP